jgi:hypothetical protein
MATTSYIVLSWIFRIYVFFNLLASLGDYPEDFIITFLTYLALSVVNDLIDCILLGFEKWYMTDDTVSVLIVVALLKVLPENHFFSIVALWLVLSVRIGYYRWMDAQKAKEESEKSVLRDLKESDLKVKNEAQELREMGEEGREIRNTLESLQAQIIRLRADSGNV